MCGINTFLARCQAPAAGNGGVENQPAPPPADPPAENAPEAEVLDPQPDQPEEMELDNEDDANNGAQGTLPQEKEGEIRLQIERHKKRET